MRAKGYNRLRVMLDHEGRFSIEKPILFGLFWWPVFRTFSEPGVQAFLNFYQLEYNTRNGYYENFE